MCGIHRADQPGGDEVHETDGAEDEFGVTKMDCVGELLSTDFIFFYLCNTSVSTAGCFMCKLPYLDGIDGMLNTSSQWTLKGTFVKLHK